jgi:flagellar biosynthesis protein FliR
MMITGALLLVLARVGPLLVLLPLPGPRLFRLLLAVLLGLAVLPGAAAPATDLLPALGRELLIGAALGICAAVPLLAAAGLLVSGERRLAELGGWLALLLFVALSGPEALLLALARSYELFPLGAAGPPLAFLPGVLLLVGRFFALGLLLAAYPLIALLLAQLLLSLALRAQALSHDLGGLITPLRPLMLIGAILLTGGLLIATLSAQLARLPAELAEVLRSLGG